MRVTLQVSKPQVVFSHAVSRSSSFVCRDVEALKRTGDGVTRTTLVQDFATNLRWRMRIGSCEGLLSQRRMGIGTVYIWMIDT